MLKLKGVGKSVAGETHLAPMDLALQDQALTVLLGATQAGKTSLMRLMAGLDAPTQGRIFEHEQDITGVAVRQRQVAMVYQQFINYPTLTVYDNIASPLKLKGDPLVHDKVLAMAQKMHIDMFLDRLPSTLSGGQQQRVALARALIKQAPLLLLDEPLVNLDYKLREELRDELSAWFAQGQGTVVYATTEPTEALLLGGYTAVLDQGELLQYGPTLEVFLQPNSIRVALAFSDPPMNMIHGVSQGSAVVLPSGQTIDLPAGQGHSGRIVLGLRASALGLHAASGTLALPSRVVLSEVSGSDTYVHLDTAWGALVMQLAGVHKLDLDMSLPIHVDLEQMYVFDAQGPLLRSPKLRAH